MSNTPGVGFGMLLAGMTLPVTAPAVLLATNIDSYAEGKGLRFLGGVLDIVLFTTSYGIAIGQLYSVDTTQMDEKTGKLAIVAGTTALYVGMKEIVRVFSPANATSLPGNAMVPLGAFAVMYAEEQSRKPTNASN